MNKSFFPSCTNLLLALLITITAGVWVGCGKEKQDASNEVEKSATSAKLLSERMTELRDKFSVDTPPEVLAIGQQARDALIASGMLKTALNVGDTAPAFVLANAVGDDVSSADLLARGPVVLIFYRGGW